MGYSPWSHKELDMTERLSLFFSPRATLSGRAPTSRAAWPESALSACTDDRCHFTKDTHAHYLT